MALSVIAWASRRCPSKIVSPALDLPARNTSATWPHHSTGPLRYCNRRPTAYGVRRHLQDITYRPGMVLHVIAPFSWSHGVTVPASGGLQRGLAPGSVVGPDLRMQQCPQPATHHSSRCGFRLRDRTRTKRNTAAVLR